jgi:cation:H+ antiporter
MKKISRLDLAFIILSAIFILNSIALQNNFKEFLSPARFVFSTPATLMLILAIALFILMHSAGLLVFLLEDLAKYFSLSRFTISFLVIGAASILPELSIALNSALDSNSSFAFGILIGSNVADLTLVIGLIAIFAGKIPIRGKLITRNFNVYLAILALPLLLLIDGAIDKWDPYLLVFAFIYYVRLIFKNKQEINALIRKVEEKKADFGLKSMTTACLIWILFSTAGIVSDNSISLANSFGLPAVFMGVLIAAFTCLPELIFSIRAVKEKREDLGLGDVMGNVLTDATFSLGIIALIAPIYLFNMDLAILAAASMLVVGFLAIHFMKTDRVLTRKEGFVLVGIYFLFIALQFLLENSLGNN